MSRVHLAAQALLVAAAWTAAPLLAQSAAPGAGPGVSVTGIALGGGSGGSDGAHMFGGAHAALTGARFGGAVQAHLGRGNGFRSLLFTAGPAYRHVLHPRLEGMVFAGAGIFRETLDSDGRSRSIRMPAGGVVIFTPVGPLRLAAGLTGWAGSYSGDDAPQAIPGNGMRAFVGAGW